MTKVRPHVLILGGTGYLGRQVALRAADEGCRVSVYGRRTVQDPGIEQAQIEFRDGVLVDAPRDVTVIINALACYGNGDVSESEITWVNRDLPIAVVEAYFFNSPESQRPLMFLNVDSALSEGVSRYANAKSELRARLRGFANDDVPVVGLRLDQFYGPADGATKFITMLVDRFLERAPHISLSPGNQQRRFLYVTDAVQTLIDVLHRALSKELVYSEESVDLLPALGEPSTVRELVLNVQKLCIGELTRLEFGALPDRGIETDPIKTAPGFEFLENRPVVQLREGLAKLLEYEHARRSTKMAIQTR